MRLQSDSKGGQDIVDASCRTSHIRDHGTRAASIVSGLSRPTDGVNSGVAMLCFAREKIKSHCREVSTEWYSQHEKDWRLAHAVAASNLTPRSDKAAVEDDRL